MAKIEWNDENKGGENTMVEQVMDLTRMKAREKGTVLEIQGGLGMTKRLEAMGIRQNVKITKVSGQFAKGPVVVSLGNTEAAIGFGMSRRIIVQVENTHPQQENSPRRVTTD
ncbi:MAG: FeoA family protein [Elusimicrobiota bacterium]